MPKRKSSLGVPVKVYNLGSPAGTLMDFDRNELWNRMDTEMRIEAVSIPVFLVNKEQMDILSPPEFQKALDPECVRRELVSFVERHGEVKSEEEEEKINSFLERLKRCEEEGWAKYKEVVAVGLYLYLGRHNRYDASFKESVLSLGDSSVLKPQAENAFLQHDKPAIFLCCERIINKANQVGISHHLVMDKVYYHELGHAIMDTLPVGVSNPYHEIWGRIVEESLANAIAYRCFKGKEARWVERLIQTQPAEYLGYAAVNQVLVAAPKYIWLEYIRHEYIWRYGYRIPPEEWPWVFIFCHSEDFWRRVVDVINQVNRFWRSMADRSEDILSYEYLISSIFSTLLKGRLDSINIALWKQFKRMMKPYDKLQIFWKNFAIYLLQSGLD